MRRRVGGAQYSPRRRLGAAHADTPPHSSQDVSVAGRVFASASRLPRRASFLVACLIVALVWLPGLLLFGPIEEIQLAVNAVLTVAIAWLMLRHYKHRRVIRPAAEKVRSAGCTKDRAAFGPERQ